MSETTAELPSTLVRIECEQRLYPPYHAFHATPDAMTWRCVTIATPQGTAVLEQTDYGHPGRWNDWEPRGVPASLQSKLRLLQALADAAGALL